MSHEHWRHWDAGRRHMTGTCCWCRHLLPSPSLPRSTTYTTPPYQIVPRPCNQYRVNISVFFGWQWNVMTLLSSSLPCYEFLLGVGDGHGACLADWRKQDELTGEMVMRKVPEVIEYGLLVKLLCKEWYFCQHPRYQGSHRWKKSLELQHFKWKDYAIAAMMLAGIIRVYVHVLQVLLY